MSQVQQQSGVQVRMTVHPDCPLAGFATRWPVVRFIHGTAGETPPQVVVDACPHDLAAEPLVDPIGTADGATICRVDTDHVTECNHNPCLSWGFEFLPIQPYNVRWQKGSVHLSFVAADETECRSIMDRLSGAGFDPELRQLTTDALDAGPEVETAVVDLSRLTDRQRSVARHAAEAGYFDADGPAAKDIAADLGISKGTLSEHLRVVQSELLDQAFSTERRT